MIEASQSQDFDEWMEAQEAFNKRRSIPRLEKDPSFSYSRPDPYPKSRWSRSSSRGDDSYQSEYQSQYPLKPRSKSDQRRSHSHSQSSSSSNSLNSCISHLTLTSIDCNQNGKKTILPVEVIDLTLDDDESDDTLPQNTSVSVVENRNNDRKEPDELLPKMEKVCKPQTDKYAEVDYDGYSDMEIDCDDAKDEDYREDSAFEEDDDDDDYYDDDSDECSNKISRQRTKRRSVPNKEDFNEPEDEVMECGIVTLRRFLPLNASPSPDHRSRSKTLVPEASPPMPDLVTPTPEPESPKPDRESPTPDPVLLVHLAKKLKESVGSVQEEVSSLQHHQEEEMELGEVLWKVWCGTEGDKVTAKRYRRYCREVVLKYTSRSRARIFTDPVMELWRRQEEEEDEDKKKVRMASVSASQEQIQAQV